LGVLLPTQSCTALANLASLAGYEWVLYIL
jgi:hypothetical protein